MTFFANIFYGIVNLHHCQATVQGLAIVSDSLRLTNNKLLLKEPRLRQLIYELFDKGWYLDTVMLKISCTLPYLRFR
mgnify:CR=1 FL=1